MNAILQHKNYNTLVQFCAAGEVFYGKVLGVNDLISFEGVSVKELKIAFEEAIEDYIELCKSIGTPI